MEGDTKKARENVEDVKLLLLYPKVTRKMLVRKLTVKELMVLCNASPEFCEWMDEDFIWHDVFQEVVEMYQKKWKITIRPLGNNMRWNCFAWDIARLIKYGEIFHQNIIS